MEREPPKVIAVVAEKTLSGVLNVISRVNLEEKYSADMIEVWLDYLTPGILNEKSTLKILEEIKRSTKKKPLNFSIRHIDSVPQERRYFEGYKGDEKDYDRNDILRKIVRVRPSFLELEHNHRWGLLFVPQTIMRYSNFNGTPDYDLLRFIYDGIKRKGADVVKLELRVNSRKDLDNLRKLRNDHANSSELITLALGKKGKRMWLEACEDGSPFVYGHTNRTADYIFGKKKPHDYMPCLEEVQRRLARVARENK